MRAPWSSWALRGWGHSRWTRQVRLLAVQHWPHLRNWVAEFLALAGCSSGTLAKSVAMSRFAHAACPLLLRSQASPRGRRPLSRRCCPSSPRAARRTAWWATSHSSRSDPSCCSLCLATRWVGTAIVCVGGADTQLSLPQRFQVASSSPQGSAYLPAHIPLIAPPGPPQARDLKSWLTIYGYWNQGGLPNVVSMFM